MENRLRFEFPQEVVRERSRVYDRIRVLLLQQTPPAIQQAKQLHLDWLQRFPDDYVALDAGEVLAMSEAACNAMHEETTNTEAEASDQITLRPQKAAIG
jgi:hypothetical protein